MFWTLELASHLEEAPWPATKDELIDYAIRSGAPLEVVENLQELEDEGGGDIYESLEDIWPDYPSQEDFFFNEDEYWWIAIRNFRKVRLLKKTSLSDKKFNPPIARRFFVICKQMRECYFGLEEGFCIPQKTISSILFSAFLYL